MDTDTQTEPEPQQQRETGWREHPDFPSLSDAELAAEEAIISDRIKWAVEDADNERWGWYRDQLRLLNAEKARRNGGSNSFPHLGDKTVRNKFQAQTWSEFIDSEPDTEEFAIEDIMPAQGLAVLGGRGK